MFQQAAHEDDHDKVWSLQCVVRARYTSGFDGRETKRTLTIRQRTAESPEVRLEQLFACVFRVRVLAVCIRLPRFDHRIVHRLTIAVDHAALYDEALTAHASRGDFPHLRV